MPKRKPKQIKQEDLVKIRKFFHEKMNKGICPILKIEFDVDEMVVDHAHKVNSKNLGTDDGSLIRGVIHRQANTMEGKITNSFIRCGLHKFDITLPEFLRYLADFIEDSPMTYLQYIHPNEKMKEPKLMKRSFNKLQRLYELKYPKRKLLIWDPHPEKKRKRKFTKKLTKKLAELYEEFELEPEFLKG